MNADLDLAAAILFRVAMDDEMSAEDSRAARLQAAMLALRAVGDAEGEYGRAYWLEEIEEIENG